MATKINISVDQGSTFSTPITVLDSNNNYKDLTTYTANAQLRKSYSSINSTAFGTSISNNIITLSLNANTTSSIIAGRYVYDVIVTDSSNVITRVVEGVVTVNPGVTRPNTTVYYYILQLANVQQTIYSGDIVYQSTGSANVTGLVYEVDGPVYGQPSNTVTIKVSNTSGTFTPNSYLLYDSNTHANATVLSVTQTVVK